MNHPKREEWVPYLFGETSSSASRHLKAHLQTCPECREVVENWKSSVGRLDAWKLPAVALAHEPLRFQPFLKWAAAAALVLFVGFAIGRVTSTKTDVEHLRAAFEPYIRNEMARAAAANLAASAEQTRKLMADYSTAFDLKRTEDIQAIYAALDKLDSQRVADALSLKQELDTVAVNADAGLRHTEQQLVQLADYTQPAGFSTTPKE